MATRDRGGRPRAALRWLRGLGQGVVALVGVLLLAAAGGLLLATQTAAGRGMAARFVEDAVGGAVDGRVEMGTITGGNLFTRAELERFRITGPRGEPFLELRDVRLSYSPLGFLTGDYRLRRLDAGRLDLHLLQGADGTWNFDRIFGGGEPDTVSADEDGGIRLLVTDATVADGLVEVRTPWAGELSGAARDSAAAAALAGEEVWRVRRGEDGAVERVITLEGISGRLPLLRLADPAEPMRLELQGLTGTARAVRQPLPVRELDAVVTFADTIRIGLDRVRSAGSDLSGRGRVVPDDPPRFRFDLEGDRIAFGELQWLPVPVPASGGGSGDLVIRSAERDPETLVVEVADGDFRAGESRATGSFALHLEETPRFEALDLRLRPVRLSLVHQLLGREGLPDGYVEGSVSGSGPIDLVRLDADVTLRRPPPGAGPDGVGDGDGAEGDAAAGADTAAGAGGPAAGASPAGAPPARRSAGPSVLRVRGGVGLVGEPRALRELELEFADFEPRWVSLVGPDPRQPGRVDGTATLDRVPGGRVAFSADVVHRVPGDSTSHVIGQGSIEGDSTPRVDLRFEADPLSLSALDPYFPAADLVGVVRGDGSAVGTLSDLEAEADLTTPRGEIRFDGRFDLAAERRAYDARLTARGIQLQQWLRDGPRTNLDVSGRVQGRGTEPATLEATFDLEVLPSVVAEARVDSSLLRFSVEGGLARVDTFAIRTDVGTLRGRGGFGLTSDRSAALLLNLDAPDLGRWNRWLVPGRGEPAAADTATEDLFALFPEAEAGGQEGADERPSPPDTLSGSLAAQGAAFGNVESFGVGGHLTVRAGRYGPVSADSLRMVLDATSARSLDSLVLSGGGGALAWGEQAVDSLSFRLQRTGSRSGDLELRARRPGASLETRAGVEWSGARKAVELASLTLGMGERTLRLAGPAAVAYGDSGLVVEGVTLEGDRGVRLQADGAVPRSGASDLDVSVEGLPLGGIRRFVGAGAEISGRLGGRLQVRGTAASPRMEASVRVDSPGVAPHRFALLEAEARYADRSVELESALRSAAGPLARIRGSVRADLALEPVERRLLEDPLDLRFTADSLPLELALAPLESVADVEGHLTARTAVTGSPAAPRLDGTGRLRGGSLRVVPLAVTFREIRAGMTFRGSEIRVDSLSLAGASGGSGSVAGAVSIATPEDPGFDLDVRARKLRAVDRRKVSVVADGEGNLGGSYRRPTLTGTFRLSNGTIRGEEFMRSDEIVDLTDPELYALVDTTAFMEQRLLARIRNPFMQNLRADVDVALGPDLWLRSSDLAVELSGEVEVRMDRAQSDVTVFGDVRLARGTYRWTASGVSGLVLSRQLRITEGEIQFVGTPGMNPNLDITATHRVRAELGTIVVMANIGGTLAEPQLALSSEPPLSENDQFCVLLINAPCSAGATGQLGPQLLGRVGTELTSLLSGGAGPDYFTVQSGAGARSRGQAGLGDGNGNGEESSLFADKELELGWYVSPELFVTVTQPLGNRFPAGSLDWRFAEAWTLELRSEHRFTQEFARSATSNLDTDRLWGLFLFREWSF